MKPRDDEITSVSPMLCGHRITEWISMKASATSAYLSLSVFNTVLSWRVIAGGGEKGPFSGKWG